MTKLLRRFMLCQQGVTAIEYALIASLIAVVIVTAVGLGGNPAAARASPVWQAPFRNGASGP